MPTTATRPTARQPHTTPPGTGHLHQALEDARDIARLHTFCSTHVCTTDQVSTDGKRLDMLLVFSLMRSKGYQVSEPTRPQQQLKKGFTTWLITVRVPEGAQAQLAFQTPDKP